MPKPAAASRAVPLSIHAIPSASRHDVLPGRVSPLCRSQNFGLELLFHLRDAHLVNFEDRDSDSCGTEQHQSSTRLERCAALQEHLRRRQLVIRHRVAGRRLAGTGSYSRQNVSRCRGVPLNAAIEDVDHPLLDVGGVNLPPGATRFAMRPYMGPGRCRPPPFRVSGPGHRAPSTAPLRPRVRAAPATPHRPRSSSGPVRGR